jgi:hypothetical protein
MLTAAMVLLIAGVVISIVSVVVWAFLIVLAIRAMPPAPRA